MLQTLQSCVTLLLLHFQNRTAPPHLQANNAITTKCDIDDSVLTTKYATACKKTNILQPICFIFFLRASVVCPIRTFPETQTWKPITFSSKKTTSVQYQWWNANAAMRILRRHFWTLPYNRGLMVPYLQNVMLLSGALQGSDLGPLLSDLFINDSALCS